MESQSSGITRDAQGFRLDRDAARDMANDFDVLRALVAGGVAFMGGTVTAETDEALFIRALNCKVKEFEKYIAPIRGGL